MHGELAQLLRRRVDLRCGAGTLHQDQLTTITQQGSGQRDQLPERADRSSGDLIQTVAQPHVFRTVSQNGGVRESQLRDLLIEPRHPPLHRLDQNELNVRASDRENQPRESGAAADITDNSRPQQWGDDGAVQNVSRPDTRKLERADQSTLFALVDEICCERASDIESLAEQNGCDRRLGLDGFSHRFT